MPTPHLEGFLTAARNDPQATLLALDIDGTVSAIAASPDAATVGPEMRATLERLAARYHLWFLSGRDADVARRLVGVERAGYVGSHGLEALDAEGLRPLAVVGGLRAHLDELTRAVVAALPQLAPFVERKRWSVAFHFRSLPESSDAPDRLRRLLDAALPPGLRAQSGKRVVEVGPAAEHSKGGAMLWLLDRLQPRRVLAAGDDLTDVTTFEALASRPGVDALRIAVRQAGETPAELLAAADMAVNGVEELHRRVLAPLAGER